jgi:hypothetical protein
MSTKAFDVVALGELLIDFTENGISEQGNPVLEANPGGAPCNVLSMLTRFGKKVAFIGKVGNDGFGHQLEKAIAEQGVATEGLRFDDVVHTTLALVLKKEDGDRDFAFYRKPGADMNLMAKIIYMEGASEPFDGQQAIAEVILNRLASEKFGTTVKSVVYAEGQFRSVPFLEDAEPFQAQYEAIERAIYGPYILPEDVVHFATFRTNDNVWGQIGGHIFCYEN